MPMQEVRRTDALGQDQQRVIHRQRDTDMELIKRIAKRLEAGIHDRGIGFGEGMEHGCFFFGVSLADGQLNVVSTGICDDVYEILAERRQVIKLIETSEYICVTTCGFAMPCPDPTVEPVTRYMNIASNPESRRVRVILVVDTNTCENVCVLRFEEGEDSDEAIVSDLNGGAGRIGVLLQDLVREVKK